MTHESAATPAVPSDDVSTLAHAAANAIFGLAVRAWSEDGAESAEASLKALADGRIHIECKAVFSRQGFSLEIEHCSHGGRQHLTTVTIKNPPAPSAMDSAGVH